MITLAERGTRFDRFTMAFAQLESASRVRYSTNTSPRAINEIVHGKCSRTPHMSIHFGAFFGQSEDFWHSIQVECDFRSLRKTDFHAADIDTSTTHVEKMEQYRHIKLAMSILSTSP